MNNCQWERLPAWRRASRPSSVCTHLFCVLCPYIPAAVNHFSSAAVKGFFPAENLLLGGAMPGLHHPGHGSNKQCFRSTTEVSNILDKSLNTTLILSVQVMLFSSEEECSRGKACGIFSVAGLSVWQMSSDLSDSLAEPQFRNLS